MNTNDDKPNEVPEPAKSVGYSTPPEATRFKKGSSLMNTVATFRLPFGPPLGVAMITTFSRKTKTANGSNDVDHQHG